MTKLNEFLVQNSISMTSFAQTVGTTTATISRVIDGSVVPRKTLMLRIFEETNGQVTPNDLVGLPSFSQSNLGDRKNGK